MIESNLCFSIPFFPNQASCKEDGTLITSPGTFELIYEDITSIRRGDIVLLIESSICCEQIAFFYIRHMLFASNKNAVLFYTFNTFLDSTVHFWINTSGIILCT